HLGRTKLKSHDITVGGRQNDLSVAVFDVDISFIGNSIYSLANVSDLDIAASVSYKGISNRIDCRVCLFTLDTDCRAHRGIYLDLIPPDTFLSHSGLTGLITRNLDPRGKTAFRILLLDGKA